MADDIDIFEGHPRDHRWDRDRNAKLLNIVFHGGTFGHFLKFFLDKFLKGSPELTSELFTDIGTSHLPNPDNFSGLIQRYHSSFINDNKGEVGLPVCLILPTTRKHHLFLKIAQWYRVLDRKITPDALWQMPLGEMPDLISQISQKVIKLYDIKGTAHYSWIPKFIVRDFYKLEFLQDLEDTHNYKWFDTFKSHEFFGSQKVYHLDLEAFFNWEVFLTNIKELDRVFGLSLDFDRSIEMKRIFDKGLELDKYRQECNRIESIIDGREEGELSGLDVSSEAFIYAHYERQFPDVQMPLTNRFFRDTEEIKQFLEYFPNWYRRPNPNLG
jgi:hypothetical protein